VVRITFFIFCILGLAACSKSSGPSSVNGQVIDKTTGKGVPYAQVYVIGASGGTIGGLGNQQSGSATADANGNFSISFNWAGGNNYSVTAQVPLYFQSQTVSTVSLTEGKNNNVKIPMVPEGFVRFNLVNAAPLDTIDEISVGDLNNTKNFSPLYKDTFFIAYGFGNTLTHFSYTIIDNHGVYHQYIDTVFLKALDTVNFTINY